MLRLSSGGLAKLLAALSVALLLLLLLGLVSAPDSLAQSRKHGDAAGSITGVVVNAGEHNVAVPNYMVTLQAVSAGVARDVATIKTDSTGHFSFVGLDTSSIVTFAVYTHYRGGLFDTPAITFTSSPTQQVTLDVYDTTASNSGLQVVSTTLLFSKPNQQKGLLSVGVLMTMQNTGTKAYVASPAPANGLPTNLLRFWLPTDAQNLTLGAGFSGLQVVQVDTGFGVDATLPPGESAFAFAYAVPYTGTSSTFQFKTEYASTHIAALVPPALRTVDQDFTSQASVTANGQRYQVLTVDNLAADRAVTFGLQNLPLPGENPDFEFWQLVLVGLGLLLLLLILALLFLRRGALAVAFGWVPASLLSSARVKSRRKSEQEAERKRLLRALLALDEQQAAGLIGPKTYRRRQTKLRSELRPLLLSLWASDRSRPRQEEVPVSESGRRNNRPEQPVTMEGRG